MYAIKQRLTESIYEVNELMMCETITKKRYNQLAKLKKKLQIAYTSLLLVRIEEG